MAPRTLPPQPAGATRQDGFRGRPAGSTAVAVARDGDRVFSCQPSFLISEVRLAVSSGIRAALAIQDFRRYALARFCATIAWQMLGVAVGWQVYAITGDPLDLGLIGLAQFLPFLLLVMPGGHVAEIGRAHV